jgi:two-component system response regulator HydG
MSRDDRVDVPRLITPTLRIRIEPAVSESVPAWTPGRPNAGGVTISGPMLQLRDLAARVAPTDLTVLITGETGVGKERLARWLHGASRRAQRPFVAVSGALADALLEIELFGHARGAFPGAIDDRPGFFETALGGTIFLDDIAEVSLAMQGKLLRAIEEGEVQRVGETTGRRVDVRLIAATSRHLLAAVAEHRFRRDLYYRLRSIDLHVPPLRERPEELRELARDLLARAARLHRPILGYTSRALDRMLAYPWPGNIHELLSAIEGACAVTTGAEIDVDDLPAAVRTRHGVDREYARRARKDREAAYIREAMDRHYGHRRRAAEELGISLSTLKRRLRDKRSLER